VAVDLSASLGVCCDVGFNFNSNTFFARSKHGLIANDVPTRAGLLLFGNNPNKLYPSAFLKLGRFRSPTTIVDDREIHGPLITQLDEAMKWFRERLSTEFIINGKPQRDVLWEYPLNAIREAVVNILCHRDYTSPAHSQIRLYDDHLELWNAGGLLSPLTPEALFQKHNSIPRNRRIADAFFYMGFIERWGSGTLRIAEELEHAHHPAPEYISESGHFKVIFHKRTLSEDNFDKIGLSQRQLTILTYLRDHETITSAEYQNITNISKRTAVREINDLLSKGVLLADGKSVGRVYRLNNEP